MLLDSRIWGNEAADDEEPSILDSYFVPQDRFSPFFDPSVRLSIARARKGMGKSALLRQCAYRVPAQRDLVVSTKGSDLVAQREQRPLTAAQHIIDWQQRLCTLLLGRLATDVGLDLGRDRAGALDVGRLVLYKGRPLAGSLMDILRQSQDTGRVRAGTIGSHEAISQAMKDASERPVWIFVDDIDATFQKSDTESIRLSAFFTACRELCASFSGINIRTCVRSDVWASIRKADEALDKCEQYIFDIMWSTRQTGLILSERIKSFATRTGRSLEDLPLEPVGRKDLTAAQSRVLSAVFPRSLRVEPIYAPPHRVIHVFSAGRPRWAAQLCRMAGEEAISVGADRILGGHIKQILEAFGRMRLDDLSREHKHQCPQMTEVVNSFSGQLTRLTTKELLLFTEKILSRMTVEVDGLRVRRGTQLSNFLFRTGIIVASSATPHGTRYYRYEDRPELLLGTVNIDEGNRWDIHPVFHAALRLKSPAQ